MLRHRSLWGTAFAHLGTVYGWYFLLTWIPYYLVEDRHWSMSGMASIGGVCYLLVAIAFMAGGSFADFWIRRGAGVTVVRKTFTCGAMGIVAVSLVGCALASTPLSVMFLMIGSAAYGIGTGNAFAVSQTLAGPMAAGRWVGFQNGFAALSGVIAPALTGILIDRTGNFILPFIAASCASLFAIFAWIVLVGPIKTIDWSERREVVPVVAGATSG